MDLLYPEAVTKTQFYNEGAATGKVLRCIHGLLLFPSVESVR